MKRNKSGYTSEEHDHSILTEGLSCMAYENHSPIGGLLSSLKTLEGLAYSVTYVVYPNPPLEIHICVNRVEFSGPSWLLLLYQHAYSPKIN